MSPGDDSTMPLSKLIRRTHLRRSLKFDNPVKNAKLKDEAKSMEVLSVENDLFEILPQNLLQSVSLQCIFHAFYSFSKLVSDLSFSP